MPGELFLAVHLHELVAYLGNRGVLTMMVLAQSATVGLPLQSAVDVSDLADELLFLRYFETQGEVRQQFQPLSAEGGNHEHTIRQLTLGPGKIHIGRPLHDFQGVLTRVPVFLGRPEES
jgi:circadian clock protein KaiC